MDGSLKFLRLTIRVWDLEMLAHLKFEVLNDNSNKNLLYISKSFQHFRFLFLFELVIQIHELLPVHEAGGDMGRP